MSTKPRPTSRSCSRMLSAGEILIGRAGEPIARLSPYQAEKREIGFASDQIWIADDFDETPEQIIRDFEG